jgi:hypothetical protein
MIIETNFFFVIFFYIFFSTPDRDFVDRFISVATIVDGNLLEAIFF